MRYLLILLTLLTGVILVAPYFGIDPLGRILSLADSGIEPSQDSYRPPVRNERAKNPAEEARRVEVTRPTAAQESTAGLAEIEELLQEK